MNGYDWLTKSPARKIQRGSFRNREFDRFITMEEYGKLLEACPSQEWRMIIALARIGGLRCPSELQRLRWKDVDWAQNRLLVYSSKTERSAKHSHRLVPLFDELRMELDKCGKTTEYVVQSFQGTAWNVYESFQEIAVLTGLGRIACPFRNMRRSRSNDVARRYGELTDLENGRSVCFASVCNDMQEVKKGGCLPHRALFVLCSFFPASPVMINGALRPLQLKKGVNRRERKGCARGRKVQFHTIFFQYTPVLPRLFILNIKIIWHVDQSANKFFGQMSRGVPQSPSGKGFYQDNSNR